MNRHPRITRPNPLLPNEIQEVMLAPGAGGFSAFVWNLKGGVETIALVGCQPDCEEWLKDALRDEHGFGPESAATVARLLFEAVQHMASRPGSRTGESEPA